MIGPIIFSLATITDKAVLCEHIVVHPQVYKNYAHAHLNRDSAWCILMDAVHTTECTILYHIVYIVLIHHSYNYLSREHRIYYFLI